MNVLDALDAQPIARGRARLFAVAAAAFTITLLLPTSLPIGDLLSEASAQDGAGERGQGGRGGEGRRGGRGGMRGGMGGGMRDIRELMEPDFVRRDVPLFVTQLELDETQSLVVETLMSDYEADYNDAVSGVTDRLRDMGRQMFSNMVTPEMRTRFQDEARAIREEIQAMEAEQGGELDREAVRNMWRERMGRLQQEMMEEQGDNGAGAAMRATMGEMFERLQAWQNRKETMRTEFVAGLQAQLTDEQLVLWPAFERFLIREKGLPRARLSGEGLNLFLVVDEARLPEESYGKIGGILDEYEVVLDQAIRTRDSVVAQTSADLYRGIEKGDVSAAMKSMERQMQVRRALRDVNDLYRGQLVAALGETDESKALDRAILEAGYERVYSEMPTERAFDVAIALDGLDADVLEGVLGLQAAFEAELASRNAQLLGLTRRYEPEQQLEEAERFVSAISGMLAGGGFNPGGFGDFGGREDDPMGEAMDARRELDRSYRERLESLLTPEQIEQLPATRRGRGGGQFAQMREQALERFDKDGDGELSSEERREMMETIRSEGGFGGRGGRGGQGGGEGGRGGRGGQGGPGGRGENN